MERRDYRVCRRNSIIHYEFFPRPAVPFQSIFARMTLNPVVQTSQACPPFKRNTRSGGITFLNCSIPGSKRSASAIGEPDLKLEGLIERQPAEETPELPLKLRLLWPF